MIKYRKTDHTSSWTPASTKNSDSITPSDSFLDHLHVALYSDQSPLCNWVQILSSYLWWPATGQPLPVLDCDWLNYPVRPCLTYIYVCLTNAFPDDLRLI